MMSSLVELEIIQYIKEAKELFKTKNKKLMNIETCHNMLKAKVKCSSPTLQFLRSQLQLDDKID